MKLEQVAEHVMNEDNLPKLLDVANMCDAIENGETLEPADLDESKIKVTAATVHRELLKLMMLLSQKYEGGK